MQALDLELARLENANFDALSQKDKATALRTSLPALLFYSRSEHSFVAIEANSQSDTQPSTVYGFIFAQSVWMGDKAFIWVSSIRVHPDAPPGCLPGLLHCVTKSAFDGSIASNASSVRRVTVRISIAAFSLTDEISLLASAAAACQH